MTEYSDFDLVSLRLASGKVISTGITSMRHSSQMLDPTPEVTFTISDPRFQEIRNQVIPGETLQVLISNSPILTGPIVRVQSNDSEWTISAYGFLHRMIVSQVEPTLRFAKGQSALEVMQQVLAPYFGDDFPVLSDDQANLKIIANQVIPEGEVDPSTKTIEHCKPKRFETSGQYLDRICKRQGLCYWGSGDGSHAVLKAPQFDVKDPLVLVRRLSQEESGTNNILSASLSLNYERQPSMVIVAGKSANSGSDPSVRVKAVALNELTGVDANGQPLASVAKWLKAHPSVKTIPIRKSLLTYRNLFAEDPICTPVYYEDPESTTSQAESENLARRMLAEFQKSAFVYQVSVQGFSQGGKRWAPNTMVMVRDERLGIAQPLYVLARDFNKSPSGTTTNMKLILPYTLQLGSDE